MIAGDHRHQWSDRSPYARCLVCDLSHRAYQEWLEERIARPLAAISWLTEPNERLAQLIAEAKRHSIGGAWPVEV